MRAISIIGTKEKLIEKDNEHILAEHMCHEHDSADDCMLVDKFRSEYNKANDKVRKLTDNFNSFIK